ncbi:RHO1 GDP-GTP exchange protein 2 [Linnemannia zychae]|nr:RHO1 GDP-GTP exchange protein 2 [Linnemannia zychae]
MAITNPQHLMIHIQMGRLHLNSHMNLSDIISLNNHLNNTTTNQRNKIIKVKVNTNHRPIHRIRVTRATLRPQQPIPIPHQLAATAIGSSFGSRSSMYGSVSSHYSIARTPSLSMAGRLLIDFNPGLLSTIAVAFRQKMLENEAKRKESESYGLEFPVTFTGKEAVDIIIELTKLDHRRHALSIARSLEKQLLFFGGGVDVLYDSNNDQYFFSESTLAYHPGKTEFPEVPTGVFPYSAKCYSYGCVPGSTSCYSYLCPNRRSINSVLERKNSDASTLGSQEKVWANSVPASVLAAASKRERTRQEIIFEVIKTEHNFIFITPLRASDIIAPERLEDFIEDIFLNYNEILDLNRALLEALRTRQEEQPLVESIGDVLLPHIVGFEEAYTRYIPRIAISEFVYTKESKQNPRFKQFLDDCTRHPEARRLGLRHFLSQPYQRLPRYPLLLSQIIRKTDDGVLDKEISQEALDVATEISKRVNSCMSDGALQVRLLSIQDKITWKSKEHNQDLKLSERSRQLHFECLARRKNGFEVLPQEYRIFVFDHMLLVTKEKRDKQGEKDDLIYQVAMNPIPLELLNVWADDGKPSPSVMKDSTSTKRRSTSTLSHGEALAAIMAPVDVNSATHRTPTSEPKNLNISPVTIEHRGRRGGLYVFTMTQKERDNFVEKTNAAKSLRKRLVSDNQLFRTNAITEMGVQPSSFALDGKRVTCTAPYLNVLDLEKRLVVGTEDGLYIGMEDDPTSFRLAIGDVNVSQISVLEAYHMLLVLSGKVLKAYNISCLEPNAEKSLQIGQQVGKSVQYFTVGEYDSKMLLAVMRKKGSNESHFTVYEPVENAVLSGNHHRGLSLSFGKSNKSEWFKFLQEFYIASDSSQLIMFSKMMCVVCPKGFELLSLDNLRDTHIFPTKGDPDFAFLSKKADSAPVSMFKISADEFLLCYSDFAFTVTNSGSLVPKAFIEWEGRPEAFAMVYPYVIAIESDLIEIRHVETGAVEQLIFGDNIRLLYSDVDLMGKNVIHLLMSDPKKTDQRRIVKLAKAPPVPKTILEPIQYQPRTTFTSQPDLSSSVSTASRKSSAAPKTPLSPTFPTSINSPIFPAPAIPIRPSSQFIQGSYTVEFEVSDNSSHHAPVAFMEMPMPKPYVPTTTYVPGKQSSAPITSVRPPVTPNIAHSSPSGTLMTLHSGQEAQEHSSVNPYAAGCSQGYPQVFPMRAPEPVQGSPIIPVQYVESPFL